VAPGVDEHVVAPALVRRVRSRATRLSTVRPLIGQRQKQRASSSRLKTRTGRWRT
jgi:hypothetical protein